MKNKIMKIFESEEEKPDFICFDCGREYLTEKQKKEEKIVTAHLSTCEFCNKQKSVTHIRNFNWLNKPEN